MSIHKTNFLQFVIFTILHLGQQRGWGEVNGVGKGPSGQERSRSGAKGVVISWFKGLSPFSL